MAVAKCKTGNIVNGIVVVNAGSTNPTYNNTGRNHVLANLTDSALLTRLAAEHNGGGWRRDVSTLPITANDVGSATGGDSSQVSYGAITGMSHVFSQITFSSDTENANGSLVVYDTTAGTTIFTGYVTKSGPGFFNFGPNGLKVVAGHAVTIVFTAGSNTSVCVTGRSLE